MGFYSKEDSNSAALRMSTYAWTDDLRELLETELRLSSNALAVSILNEPTVYSEPWPPESSVPGAWAIQRQPKPVPD